MDTLWMKARSECKSGRLSRSLRFYVAACECNPNEAELWRERGFVALLAGNLREASSALFKSADMFARRGKPLVAHAIMTQVVQIDSTNMDARSFEQFLRRRVTMRREERAGQARAEPRARGSDRHCEPSATVATDCGEVGDAGVPLVFAQTVVQAVLEANLLPKMRSDQMRYLFERCRIVALDGGERRRAPLEEYAYLVADGVITLERPVAGTKTLFSRGELLGGAEASPSQWMLCVSAGALLLVIPRSALTALRSSAAPAVTTGALTTPA